MRAGFVQSAEAYAWSSARAHVTGWDEWDMLDLAAWEEICDREQWRQILSAAAERHEYEMLERASYGGKPYGERVSAASCRPESGGTWTCAGRAGPERRGSLPSRNRQTGDRPGFLSDLSTEQLRLSTSGDSFGLLCIGISCTIGLDPLYRGPRCLGQFCVDRRIEAAAITRALSSPGRPPSEVCYRDSSGVRYLTMRSLHNDPSTLVEVLLSEFPTCPELAYRNVSAFVLDWKTGEGVGLGSPEVLVQTSYGKPDAIENVSAKTYSILTRGQVSGKQTGKLIGERSLSYMGKRERTAIGDAIAEFGINNGRVSWILVSVNE